MLLSSLITRVKLTAGIHVSREIINETGDGSKTLFSLDENIILVDKIMSGSSLVASSAYTIDYDYNTVTFTSAPSNGSEIDIYSKISSIDIMDEDIINILKGRFDYYNEFLFTSTTYTATASGTDWIIAPDLEDIDGTILVYAAAIDLVGAMSQYISDGLFRVKLGDVSVQAQSPVEYKQRSALLQTTLNDLINDIGLTRSSGENLDLYEHLQ